jgi:hypothetical protein
MYWVQRTNVPPPPHHSLFFMNSTPPFWYLLLFLSFHCFHRSIMHRTLTLAILYPLPPHKFRQPPTKYISNAAQKIFI